MISTPEYEPQRGCPGALEQPGQLLVVHGVTHRHVATCGHRALLVSLDDHHVWLAEDADGSIQLPTIEHVYAMIRSGSARVVSSRSIRNPSPTARMRREIEMLDAAGVRQGDKAIWQHLARHWTRDLVDQFGPHDDPWRIRRWRAALRKAAK